MLVLSISQHESKGYPVSVTILLSELQPFFHLMYLLSHFDTFSCLKLYLYPARHVFFDTFKRNRMAYMCHRYIAQISFV